jgi:hypothetical protein
MGKAISTIAVTDSLATLAELKYGWRWRSLESPVRPGMLPKFGDVKPWCIPDVATVRPGPPPAPGSPEFIADVNEIKDFTENPTSETRRIANFWADGPSTSTPPGHWNAIASDLNEEYLFAATEIGPYIFSFSSKKWSYMGGSKATDAVYWSVQYLPKSKTVRFGTYARGIWDFVIEKKINGTTEVKSENKNDYKLNVYPNPVKDDLNINFMLTQKNNVIITFYDLAGKKVHEIVKKDLQIGVQNINWNSVLDNGTKLPNGNYICIVSIKDNVDYSKFSINR